MVDTFLKKSGSLFSNFYFCHSAGTGKTVLLKLFGHELQQRGFAVFMLTAPELDQCGKYCFKDLVDNLSRDGKQVAILVNEVQKNVNSYHWDYLLKKAPSNLLVVGTGISDQLDESPQFLDKLPSFDYPSIGQLTDEDMPEVMAHFIPKGEADSQWDVKVKAMNEVLVATGGQLYPFAIIASHLLKPERMEHLTNVSAYLTSKTFYCSEDYARVRKRCYSLSETKVKLLARFLLEQPHGAADSENAMKSGLLLAGTDFVSPLLVQQVFREQIAISPSTEFKLDLTGKSAPVVEQIIAAGLVNMKALDFEEANFSTLDNNERGLAFRWGVGCGSALKNQVWLTYEVVAEEQAGQKGTKPFIDFVVNDKLNLCLEVAKDRTDEEMVEKLQKIQKGGVYSRHDSYLFHFVLSGDMSDVVRQVGKFPVNMHTRVYTYLKNDNSLMCGTKIVRKEVVRRLPSPLSMYPAGRARQFSTLTLGALRRLGKIL